MPGANGLAHPLREEEAFTMAGSHDSTTRLFDKLDQIQSSQATMMADIARVQGAQSGMQLSITTVSTAIGDVNETKLESRETKGKIEALEKSINELKEDIDNKDNRYWVEGLVKWAIGGLSIGGGFGIGNAILQRVL